MSIAAIQESLGFAREPSVSIAENTQIINPCAPPPGDSGGSPSIVFTTPGEAPEDFTQVKAIMLSDAWINAHDRMRRGRQARIDRDAKLMVKSWDMNTAWLLKYNDPQGEGPVTVGYVCFTEIDEKYLQYVNQPLRDRLHAKVGDYRFGIHFIEGMRGKGMFKQIIDFSILKYRQTLEEKGKRPRSVFASCYADNVPAVRAFTSLMKGGKPGKDAYVSTKSALFKIF